MAYKKGEKIIITVPPQISLMHDIAGVQPKELIDRFLADLGRTQSSFDSYSRHTAELYFHEAVINNLNTMNQRRIVAYLKELENIRKEINNLHRSGIKTLGIPERRLLDKLIRSFSPDE